MQPQAMSYLHADLFLPEANVLPNLNLDHSLDELVELGDSFSSTQKLKVFAGYAGWSPGQIENELAQNAWLTVPADTEVLFALPCDARVPAAMQLLGIDFASLSEEAGHA